MDSNIVLNLDKSTLLHFDEAYEEPIKAKRTEPDVT